MDKLFGTSVENFKNEGGYTTASEIYHQPSVWEDTLEIIEEKKDEINEFLKPILAKKDLNIIFSAMVSLSMKIPHPVIVREELPPLRKNHKGVPKKAARVPLRRSLTMDQLPQSRD